MKFGIHKIGKLNKSKKKKFLKEWFRAKHEQFIGIKDKPKMLYRIAKWLVFSGVALFVAGMLFMFIFIIIHFD